MSQFFTPAQQAVFTRLSAAVTLASVYDDVPGLPEGQPDDSFPYIVIGQDYSSLWDTDSTLGNQVYVQVHCWSRYQGKKEVKAIMAEVDAALHRQAANLTAAGFNFVDCLLEFATVFDENDGVTRHGVCRYRLTVEKE